MTIPERKNVVTTKNPRGYAVVEPTHLTNMIVKLEIFPKIGMKILKKCLKPPPRAFSQVLWSL